MKNLQVLLVDDEDEFINTLAERMELRGFNVQTAINGEEAMDRLARGLPDIVFLDVMMPGIGGLDILKQIKALYKNLPVILLTGRSSTEDGIKGMRLGALDYLVKPIDIEELIRKIEENVN
ncbi:MAG: response regulator [Desulfobacteraceae bacterium]|nr:response regulator [Desulfobacteraceae bacterium]